MTAERWKLPVPATALTGGPELKQLLRRCCELSFQIDDDGVEKRIRILFKDVAAFKCSYLAACTTEMFTIAYGRIVDLGTTAWLTEIGNAGRRDTTLRHLIICFDDGPCYEFACRSFSIDYPAPA